MSVLALCLFPDLQMAIVDAGDKLKEFVTIENIGLATSFTMVSIAKATKTDGRPNMKLGKAYIFDMDDVDNFPARDANGVKSGTSEDLTFLAGKTAIVIEFTEETLERFDEYVDTPDAEGWKNHVKFEVPGDALALNEFIENKSSDNLGTLTYLPGFLQGRLAGNPNQPLRFKLDEVDSKEGIKKTFEFISMIQGPKTMHYVGAVPALDTDASGSGT